MTTFEGPVKSIQNDPAVVFGFLTDFNNLGPLLPFDKVSGWECTRETCRMRFDGIGEIGLRIVEKVAPNTIKYEADEKTAISFFLWVQLKEVAPSDTRVKLTLKAELNPMMKMMVSSPVQKFLETITTAIADHPYKRGD